jgi:hypothetical protein
MKVLKVILIVLLIPIVALIGIGLTVPNFEYGNRISVKASVQRCWDVYNDTTIRNQWIDGYRSHRLQLGEAMQPGARYETVIDSGEKMTMSETLSAIKPANSIAWRLDNDVLTSAYSYSFEGDSSRTIISTHYNVSGKNVFMRSVLLLSKSYLKNTDAEMLEKLKGIAEKNRSK